jgi:hypothetical protein
MPPPGNFLHRSFSHFCSISETSQAAGGADGAQAAVLRRLGLGGRRSRRSWSNRRSSTWWWRRHMACCWRGSSPPATPCCSIGCSAAPLPHASCWPPPHRRRAPPWTCIWRPTASTRRTAGQRITAFPASPSPAPRTWAATSPYFCVKNSTHRESSTSDKRRKLARCKALCYWLLRFGRAGG